MKQQNGVSFNMMFTVEIDRLDNKIYIATENSSGAVYDGSTPEDVGFAVQCYCEDYLEGEF